MKEWQLASTRVPGAAHAQVDPRRKQEGETNQERRMSSVIVFTDTRSLLYREMAGLLREIQSWTATKGF